MNEAKREGGIKLRGGKEGEREKKRGGVAGGGT